VIAYSCRLEEIFDAVRTWIDVELAGSADERG